MLLVMRNIWLDWLSFVLFSCLHCITVILDLTHIINHMTYTPNLPHFLCSTSNFHSSLITSSAVHPWDKVSSSASGLWLEIRPPIKPREIGHWPLWSRAAGVQVCFCHSFEEGMCQSSCLIFAYWLWEIVERHLSTILNTYRGNQLLFPVQ